ncbi:unnamed protein product, partial [Staurois parvus]
MNMTVEDRCGDTEGDLTNVSNIGNTVWNVSNNISSIDRNVMDNISSIDGNVIDNVCIVEGNVVLGAEVQSLGAEQGDDLDRPVPCPGSEDCALISAQPLALHRTRQLAGTCSSTPPAALK